MSKSTNMFTDMVKKMGADVHFASEELHSAQYSGTMDTGSYVLNAATSGSIFGGIPTNKVVQYAGPSTTGKTFFALGIVTSFQKANPEGVVIYFDTEAAVTRQMMSDRGIDPSRVVVIEPETIQDFRMRALQAIKMYSETPVEKRLPMMFVLDSLGQLSSIKEMEDSESGSNTRDMTKQQLIRGAFRTIRLRLAKIDCPMIMTNHTYEVIGAFRPTQTASGGGGPKFTSDIVQMLSKAKDRKSSVDHTVIGNIITVRNEKNRIAKENTAVRVKLSYDTGLDRHFGLLDLALVGGLVKKTPSGKKYIMPNGKEYFESAVYKDPTKHFTDEFLQQIDEVAQSIFSYGDDSEESAVDLDAVLEEADG